MNLLTTLQPQYAAKVPVTTNTQTTYGAKDIKKEKRHETKVRAAALSGSVIGSGLFLLAMAKKASKGDFNYSKLMKVNFKNPIKVMGLATSSIIGGLTGGLLADKKSERKPKLKEAIHQFIGNVFLPISIVGTAVSAIEKRNFPKSKEIILSGIASILGVGTGVVGGNFIAEKLNNKIFKEDDKRKLGVKDFGIHIDDIMTLVALTSNGPKIQSFISKALPAIFLICGFEAGTKNNKEKTL